MKPRIHHSSIKTVKTCTLPYMPQKMMKAEDKKNPKIPPITTNDWDKVTCKKCLDRREKRFFHSYP